MNNSIILLLFFIIPLHAFACSADGFAHNGSATVSFTISNILAQRDSPVGTVLADVTASYPGDEWHYYNDGSCTLYYIMSGYGAQETALQDVYATSVSGVGIKSSIYSYSSGTTIYASPDPGTSLGLQALGGAGLGVAEFQLIKTGDITSGQLDSGQISYLIDNAPSATTMKWNLTAAVPVTVAACSITSGASLSFPIGDTPANQFTSTGTVSQQTSTQNLGVNCDPGSNINVTLNGSQNSETNDPSVLALTSGEGMATGVGVQLLYNGSPMELGTMLNLKTSASGQESFPITARYIQTKDTVTPGTANATATLNITYQ